MLDFLKDVGIVGFWFFLVKGILWLVLLALVYFKVINKSSINNLKNKLRWKKKKN
jgi:hypothetical protein